MRRNINLLGIALVMISFFAFSGLDCESGGVELRIVTTGNNFSGYYIIDGGKENFFTGNVDGNGLYKYSKNLGIFKHVEISATKDYPSSTMDLYLYDQNGDVIQKINNASCDIGPASTSTCTNSSSMSYTYQTAGSN